MYGLPPQRFSDSERNKKLQNIKLVLEIRGLLRSWLKPGFYFVTLAIALLGNIYQLRDSKLNANDASRRIEDAEKASREAGEREREVQLLIGSVLSAVQSAETEMSYLHSLELDHDPASHEGPCIGFQLSYHISESYARIQSWMKQFDSLFLAIPDLGIRGTIPITGDDRFQVVLEVHPYYLHTLVAVTLIGPGLTVESGVRTVSALDPKEHVWTFWHPTAFPTGFSIRLTSKNGWRNIEAISDISAFAPQ